MPGITLGEIVSVPGAEADALATMTFDNAPLRVYLCFAQMAQGESALVLISLFDDRHIDLRSFGAAARAVRYTRCLGYGH